MNLPARLALRLAAWGGVRYGTANLDFATGAKKDRRHLRRLCRRHAVLLVVEAKNIDLASLLPDGWATTQHTGGLDEQGKPRDPARAGSAICYDTRLVRLIRHRLVLGVDPYIDGARVRMESRYIAVGVIEEKPTGARRKVLAVHYPPDRFEKLQPPMERVLARLVRNSRLPVIVGADFNQQIGRVAARLCLHPVGVGIVGLLVDHRLRTTRPAVSRWGRRMRLTDHPTVGLTVKEAS